MQYCYAVQAFKGSKNRDLTKIQKKERKEISLIQRPTGIQEKKWQKVNNKCQQNDRR